MFQNRHQQGNSSQQQMKLSVDDHLDRIRNEFSMLQNQLQQARNEIDKANQANQELTQRYYLSYQESMFGMYIESQKNVEIVKRLSNLITHIIPQLPTHTQEPMMQATERAKTVNQQDLQNIMQQQQQMVAASMFPGMAASAGLGASVMGPAAVAAAAAAFNPAMLGMAGVKQEDAFQAAAAFQNFFKNPAAAAAMFPNALGLPATIPPNLAGPSTSSNSVSLTGLNDDAVQLPSRHSSSSTHRVSSAALRPHSEDNSISAADVGGSSKRAKVEQPEEGELEIDVQNDDATSSAAPSHTNGRNSHPRGSSRSHHQKDDRDSTQSATSSRDSATPRSKRQSSTPNSLAGYLPPGTSPEMANLLLNSATGTRFPIPDLQNRWLGAIPQMNGKPAYAYRVAQEGDVPTPVSFPNDASCGLNVMQSMKRLGELPHGDVVCAVTVTRDNRQVFTGGRGCVKVWDVNRLCDPSFSPATDDPSSPSNLHKTPVMKLDCLNDSYIRFCKLFNDNSTLIVGGESQNIFIWDLTNQVIRNELSCETQACYALAITPDDRMCFACCSDGNIIIWDLVSETKVATLNGHAEGASCVDLSPDQNKLWTGGLDNTVRSWDIRENTELNKYQLDSQVFSLGCCPTEDYVAVGMENNHIEVLNTLGQEKYVLHDHESCVLSLKFAHSGKWFVSTGKDNYLSTWRTPYGYRLLKRKEASSILSCDISVDDTICVTGSGDRKATVYRVDY